jgi:hypothetical protein
LIYEAALVFGDETIIKNVKKIRPDSGNAPIMIPGCASK